MDEPARNQTFRADHAQPGSWTGVVKLPVNGHNAEVLFTHAPARGPRFIYAPGRDVSVPEKKGSGTCEKIAGRKVAAGLPRHISSIVRTAMAG